MAQFMVQVLWVMVAQVAVEADTLNEAVEKQRQSKDLPANGVYLDDSCEVSGDLLDSNSDLPDMPGQSFPGYCGPGQGPGQGQSDRENLEKFPNLCGTRLPGSKT
jgi:hypothetical protein